MISSFKILSHIYFNDQKVTLPLPEAIGICRYFILYGLVNQGQKPEKIMPAQQTVAAAPVRLNVKGGKVLYNSPLFFILYYVWMSFICY